MSQRSDLIEFTLIMGRETSAKPRDIERILSLARAHCSLATTMCNRELNPSENQRLESLERGLGLLGTQLLIPEIVDVILSRDPRGCTVKLVLKSGTTNDSGKEGVCVPQPE